MEMDERTLHQLELPSPTTTHPYIPNPPLLYHVMQRLHSLFNRCFRIESVKLQDIDVFELKPLQGVLHRSKDPLIHQLSLTLSEFELDRPFD